MKLFLTSNGLSNDTIAKAFEGLIGKKPKDTKVAFIPTAANPVRIDKGWLIDDMYRIKRLGYYVDVLELTALKTDEIKAALYDADVIFVGGGNTFYLSYWMQEKGVFDLIPDLLKTRVYAGISAGSILAGSSLLPSTMIKDGYIDEHYYEKSIKDEGSDKALCLANIIFRSHFNSDSFPMINKDNLAKIAPKLKYPIFALDDNSALKIDGDRMELVTEGEYWVSDNSV